MSASRLFTRPLGLGPVWLLAPLVGVLLAASIEPIPPHDYWWHLVMGRLVAFGHGVPDTNLFLYTMPIDAPFHDQPWLGQLLMYIAHDWGGPAATIGTRNALVGVSWGLVLGLAYKLSGSARATGALGLLFAVSTFPVLTVRTRMFAFVPYALLLWWVVRFALRQIRVRDIALVSVGVVFWANTHGSFVLAPLIAFGITGCLLLETLASERRIDVEALKFGSLSTVAFFAAGCVNPSGWGSYTYVIHLALTSTVASTVTEWKPPDVTDPVGMVFLAGVVLSVAFLVWRRRSVRVWEAGLLLVTTYLAASAVRSIFFWAPAVVIILVRHVAEVIPDEDPAERTPGKERLNIALLLGLVVLAVAVQPGAGREFIVKSTQGEAIRSGRGAGYYSAETPLATLERLKSDDRVFHHQAIGGLLEYEATSGAEPRQVAFVDQRMELVPEDVWSEYFRISAAEGEWLENLDAYQVNVLILSPRTQWRLLQEALKSPEWQLDHLGASQVMFRRTTAQASTQ